MGLELGDHLADRLAADQLVRQHHPRHAEAAADHQLLDGRDRDPQGAIGELAGEQLGRHRGLAMGQRRTSKRSRKPASSGCCG